MSIKWSTSIRQSKFTAEYCILSFCYVLCGEVHTSDVFGMSFTYTISYIKFKDTVLYTKDFYSMRLDEWQKHLFSTYYEERKDYQGIYNIVRWCTPLYSLMSDIMHNQHYWRETNHKTNYVISIMFLWSSWFLYIRLAICCFYDCSALLLRFKCLYAVYYLCSSFQVDAVAKNSNSLLLGIYWKG